MSRSNNTELINPAIRFFEWNGDKGLIKYYDRKLERQIEIALPFQFLALDCLSTIAGFSDADNSGFWSNDIRDLKTGSFIVRNKKGKVFEGDYEQLKAANITGVKYCQSVYIAFKDETGKMQIGNVKMMGSSLGSWIEFRKKNKIFDSAITISGCLEGKKGKTIYQMPVFEACEASKSDNDAAIALDKELQSYLTAYFSKAKSVEDSVPEEELSEAVTAAHEKVFGAAKDMYDGDHTDDLPF